MLLGTGKTKTILGLLSVLVETFEQEGSKITPALDGNKRPNHPILICAPSNAAVDEICLRLLEEGLYTKVYTHSASFEDHTLW